MSFLGSIGNFFTNDIVKPIESAGSAIGNFVNQDIVQPIEKHPLEALGIGAGIAGSIALPFLAPEFLGGAGLLGAGDAAGLAGAGLGADAAAAGAPLDILAGGAAEGTAGLETLGSVAPAVGAAGGGLAPDLTLAGLAGSGYPAALPGIASGLGTFSPALSYSPADSGIGASGAGLPSAITSPGLGGAAPVSLSDAGTAGGGIGGTSLGGSSALSAGDSFSSLGEAATGAPAGGASTGSWLDSATNWLNKYGTVASLGLGAANIARQALTGNQIPNQGNLQQIAGQAGSQASSLSTEGQGLLGPIQGGPLPPALEQQVTNALNDAIATTKARYAQLGLSGSTMESDQIAYLQQQAVAQRGTLAQQLAQEGNALISQSAADLGIESGIYTNLMNAQISADNALSSSIASFAGAAANAFATQGRPTYNITATKAA